MLALLIFAAVVVLTVYLLVWRKMTADYRALFIIATLYLLTTLIASLSQVQVYTFTECSTVQTCTPTALGQTCVSNQTCAPKTAYAVDYSAHVALLLSAPLAAAFFIYAALVLLISMALNA